MVNKAMNDEFTSFTLINPFEWSPSQPSQPTSSLVVCRFFVGAWAAKEDSDGTWQEVEQQQREAGPARNNGEVPKKWRKNDNERKRGRKIESRECCIKSSWMGKMDWTQLYSYEFLLSHLKVKWTTCFVVVGCCDSLLLTSRCVTLTWRVTSERWLFNCLLSWSFLVHVV